LALNVEIDATSILLFRLFLSQEDESKSSSISTLQFCPSFTFCGGSSSKTSEIDSAALSRMFKTFSSSLASQQYFSKSVQELHFHNCNENAVYPELFLQQKLAQSFTALRVLSFHTLKDNELSAILQQTPVLEDFSCSVTPSLNGRCVANLKHRGKLKKLRIDAIPRFDWKKFPWDLFESLEFLSLISSGLVDSELILDTLASSKVASSLVEIDLSRNNLLSREHVIENIPKFQNMQIVNLRWCPSISKQSKQEIIELMPQVKFNF
jgi:hypothetical protein